MRVWVGRNRDTVWGVLTGQGSDSITGLVMHEVKEIETWILRLLSAPVPVPGKTRVEYLIETLNVKNDETLQNCLALFISDVYLCSGLTCQQMADIRIAVYCYDDFFEDVADDYFLTELQIETINLQAIGIL
ncbi:hypothetical protein KUTeg_023583 [Tegillarca granosa]|uniref:Uncharacterized protein n=1 Tax=Tegillarca granosa TaxID=220873 RepID=A0ABQ9E255_TEGGR|nr:hypothetical protein KUTeg_023583 [Tegillarca granosa]